MSRNTGATRARPLSIEDRRAMIIAAAAPLLMERGTAVTTRQIADAAGIAEGTIFRAFDDKESLIRATVEHHLDPEPLRQSLREIDAGLALEEKVPLILSLLRARFSGVFRMMAALAHLDGHTPGPPHRPDRLEYATIVANALEPDLARLNCPAERVAPFIRLVAFSSSLPTFAEASPFSEDELSRLVLYGIAGATGDAT
ncbi:helix-turn-helix domain containing protein [Microbacterium sp. STN6]|uniref:TetR/AcrR family transcriptional regulator n=1 Tax=Microbacterium sp. STN6 TaxID=2995588 RepID=UPI00226090FB|nr:TetR/AcrR family transcriptional regulator [Microbacterium sp. STN6]MCX7521183.1 helix-turn-helix domain containing protein [Microbacterium sp. STN6]